MANLANFVFFNSESTQSESNVLQNNGAGEELKVQVSGIGSGTAALKFKGKVDYNATEFVELSCIAEDFSVVTQITADGIYSIPMTGVIQIKGVCTAGLGNFKAYGILVG